MKNLVYIFVLVLMLSCCKDPYSKVRIPAYKPDTTSINPVDTMTSEQCDAYLDSMTAQGEYVLVRGADRYCDTIIDHIHYIFITEE